MMCSLKPAVQLCRTSSDHTVGFIMMIKVPGKGRVCIPEGLTKA